MDHRPRPSAVLTGSQLSARHTELVTDDNYELDDDPMRVDRDVVTEFLTTEAYWGRWRGRAEIDRQLDCAWRVIGAYERSTAVMVGFARAVSDGVSRPIWPTSSSSVPTVAAASVPSSCRQ